MGLQNFEKDFKQKLREREIDPSAASWDRLEAQLETQKKKKYSFWWIGIAACIAGAVLMLDRFYFVSENPTSQEVVENPVEAEQTEEVPGAVEIPEVEETVLAIDEQKEPVEGTPTNNKQQKVGPEPETAVAQAEAEVHKPIVEEKIQTGLNRHEELISSKLEQVVAEVASREVTDAEIDALLHRAAREIETGRASAVSTANVDPRSLLQEVEMELERSFREKVLDLLREGYMRTRTAVANRGF